MTTEPKNDPARGCDRVLQNLAARENADNQEAGTAVILLCGGAIVSGRLVSGLAFVTDAIESDSFFNPLREDYSELVTDSEIPEAAIENTTFIHLKDVTVHQGGTVIQLRFWRGQIDRVDGWTLGTLTTKPRVADEG